MSSLIAKVRTLIGDPAGGTQAFTDDVIQDALDRTRLDIRYEPLHAAPDIQSPQGNSSTANFVWATYFSAYQWWEADVVLQGNNTTTGKSWILLTPVTSDLLSGKWTFDVVLPAIGTPPAQYPPVWATGKTYDIYGVAADMLENWAALQLDAFDFTADGRTFRRSQKFDQRLKLAAIYRRSARVDSIPTVRRDAQWQPHTHPTKLLGPALGSPLDEAMLGGDDQ